VPPIIKGTDIKYEYEKKIGVYI